MNEKAFVKGECRECVPAGLAPAYRLKNEQD